MAEPIERILPSGRKVTLEMPDLYAALPAASIPNPLLIPVLALLDTQDSNAGLDSTQLAIARAERYRGLVNLASLCLVSPRLVLKEAERKEGDIGPRDLRYNDLWYIYNFFCRDPESAFAALLGSNLPSGPPPPLPDEPGVPLPG